MRTLIVAMFLACVTSALAGDAVDQALVDLGADESEKRDAAEKLLWNTDGSAWERAKAVLEKSTDAEVKARLGPIVDWMAVQSKCAPLEAAWKDRWFVVREEGEIVGTERQQAVLEDDAGLRTWRFTHESDCILKESHPEHFRLVLRARHDPHMTPVDGELQVTGPEGTARLKFTWKAGQLNSEVIENTGKGSSLLRRSRGTMPLERDGDIPFTVDALIAERIERASLARLDRIEFLANYFMEGSGTKCLPYVAQFGGVQTVEVAGKRIEARRYFHQGGPAAEFWVSDTLGLVRAVIDRLELTRVDEATARAAGLDPASMRLKEAKQRVEELLASQGDNSRSSAELAVLATPEALGPVREALTGPLDDDLNARLTRCANWLNPEFARADMARTWRERYFQVEIEKRRVGAERFGATVVDAGGSPALSWTGECASEGTRGTIRSSWSGRTRFDSFLTPLEAEFRHVSEEGHVARWHVGVVEGRAVVRSIEGEKPRYDGASGYGNDEDNASRAAPTFDPCLSALLERVSLCRLPEVRLQTWRLGQEEGEAVRFAKVKFEGEATETRNGVACLVRHYVVAGSNLEHYWFTDAEGLVRMTYHDCTVTPITRDEWLSSGWDEASLVARIFKSRLDALRGNDASAANEALLALQTSPESLPALREAAVSEKDSACKSRLESLCRWLDPAFGRAEIAKIGGARWFANRKGGVRRGWKRLGAKADVEGRWSLSVGSCEDVAAPDEGNLDATFTGPDFGVTNSLDAEVDMHARGSHIVISAEFRGTSIALKKVRIDGEQLAVQGDTKTLSGTARGAILPSDLLPLLLERASLARLECLQVSTWDLLGGSRLTTTTLVFAGKERLKADGKEVATRKYEVAGNGDAGTWWIADETGVVKFHRDGLESVLSTEADAKDLAK
ncbi:MAG: hypothetical protein AAB074_21065 [Planctomycetota bacterium]